MRRPWKVGAGRAGGICLPLLTILLVLLVGCLASPGNAQAGSISATSWPGLGGATLQFADKLDESNDLTVSWDGLSRKWTVVDAANSFLDQGLLNGCEVSANVATCEGPPAGSDLGLFAFSLGGGDDRLVVEGSPTIRKVEVRGGFESDFIDLGPISTRTVPESQWAFGDPSYETSPPLDPNSGEPLEPDPSELLRHGDDWIRAGQGDQNGDYAISGGAGSDILIGGPKGDNIDDGDLEDRHELGLAPPEYGDGNDVLLGGAGGDVLSSHTGADSLSGGEGNDWLDEFHLREDGALDDFSCGAGEDRATLGVGDAMTPDCEETVRFSYCPSGPPRDCVFVNSASTVPLPVGVTSSRALARTEPRVVRRRAIRLTASSRVAVPPGKRRRVVLDLLKRRARLALVDRQTARARFVERRKAGRLTVRVKRKRFLLRHRVRVGPSGP